MFILKITLKFYFFAFLNILILHHKFLYFFVFSIFIKFQDYLKSSFNNRNKKNIYINPNIKDSTKYFQSHQRNLKEPLVKDFSQLKAIRFISVAIFHLWEHFCLFITNNVTPG